MATLSVQFPFGALEASHLGVHIERITEAKMRLKALLQIRIQPGGSVVPSDQEKVQEIRLLVQLITDLSAIVRENFSLEYLVGTDVLTELKMAAARDTERLLAKPVVVAPVTPPIVVRPAVPIELSPNRPATAIDIHYQGRRLPRRSDT